MAASVEQKHVWVKRVLEVDVLALRQKVGAVRRKSDLDSLASGQGGDQPPGKTPPDKPADLVLPELWDQTVVWNPPNLTFGVALNSLPPATIVEGNVGAPITYEPALDAMVPPVGVMTIYVSVPGNAAFRPVLRRPFAVTVGARSLVVTVQPAEMAAGGPVPDLQYVADSLAPGDATTVAFDGAPDARSAVKLDGYPVAPVVAFTHGSAANYAITLVSGLVVVTRSFNDMDAEITRLRHGFLGLPSGPSKDTAEAKSKARLVARLDEVEKKRDKRDLAPAALEKLLRELDRELYDVTYVPVTAVEVVCVAGEARIARDETVTLKATVEPANATEQGVIWQPDDPELIAVSQTGEATRAPDSVAGGKAVARATSVSRERISGALAIEVTPKPTSIKIDAPEHVFFDGKAVLKAQVQPLDAPQDVVWSIVSGRKPVVNLTGSGELSIARPAQHQKIAGGRLTIQAKSATVPSLTEQCWIDFGGYAATDIQIELPRNAKFQIGAELLVTARVIPDNASQEVEWSFSGGDMATMGEPRANAVPVRFDKPGQVELTATTTDGTGIARSRWLGAPVPLVSVAIACPKATIELGQTMDLAPVFEPLTAKCAVSWSSSDTSILRVDRKTGKLSPAKTGKATITVAADDKSRSMEISVTALSDTSVLSADQASVVLSLIDAYAVRIGIRADDKTYLSYRYKLAQDAAGGGRETTAGRVPVALSTVRAELIAMRNNRYTKEHAEWLDAAGLTGGSGNCRTRECGSAELTSMTFNESHLTLFDTKAQLPIGGTSDALVAAVLRNSIAGMAGLHLTAYAASKAEEMKVYNSGTPWTPKFEIIADWAETFDPDWTEEWRNVLAFSYKNYQFMDRVRNELKAWFDGQIPDRIAALKAAYDAVKQHDAAPIG